MPVSDTPATARSARIARLVLLTALSAGLGGLALPGVTGTPAAGRAGTALGAPRVPQERAWVVFAPVLTTPPRTIARATRSRVSLPLWVRPVDAPIDSPFGARWGSWHSGIDFGAPYGAAIHAVGAGVVIGAGYLADEEGYGQIVLIQHSPGVVTAYAHTSTLLVRPGEHVVAGQVIARVGATGYATGPHLHFEVRLNGVKVDPVPWLRAHGVRVS